MATENHPPSVEEPNQQSDPAVNNQPIKPVKDFLFTFPPFPEPPPGVHIMTFKDFQEHGICLNSGPNGEEIDGWGIPTVPIQVKHKLDGCKTNTKRKRRKEEEKARKREGLPANKIPWWELWEDGEIARFATVDHQSSRFDRLQDAANDFTNKHTWPVTYASETGPKFLWEKLQRYMGITVLTPVGKKKKKNKITAIGIPTYEADDASDDESDHDMPQVPKKAREEVEEEVVEEEAGSSILLDKHAQMLAQMSANEERMSQFFEDPEKSIRIFLSSYARQMGFVWSDANNECIGRVLDFFVKFVIRSKALPEIEKDLQRSLKVIKLSIEELPNTSKLAKLFPDKLSQACNACFGTQGEGYQTFHIDIPEVEDHEPKKETENIEGDPVTKGLATEQEEAISTEEKNPGWGGWSAADSNWGSGWGDPSTESPWVDSTPKQEEILSGWELMPPENLMTFLGPTALPFTHTVGVVENSMRRIKAIVPPPSNPPKSSPQAPDAYDPDPEAVEVELDRQFTKVILGPMIDWDGGEAPSYARPRILIDKKFVEVPEPLAESVPDLESGTTPTPPKPHNPFNDEITLLIQGDPPEIAGQQQQKITDLLTVGMGLGGVWVQIVRQPDAVVKKKKKGKSKSKKVIPNFWYLDELAIIIPSFWTI